MLTPAATWSFHLVASLHNKHACVFPYTELGIVSRSNAAVVWATGNKSCCCLPLHCKEGNCSKEAHKHHDQELPLQKEVVAVEICNCSTDGLGGKKTQCKKIISGNIQASITTEGLSNWHIYSLICQSQWYASVEDIQS